MYLICIGCSKDFLFWSGHTRIVSARTWYSVKQYTEKWLIEAMI